jgi:hypothetical protein
VEVVEGVRSIGCEVVMAADDGDVVEWWRWWRDTIVWQRWWRWAGVGLMLCLTQRRILPLLLLAKDVDGVG